MLPSADSQSVERDATIPAWVLLLCITCVVLACLYTLGVYIVNIPFLDDFNDILRFLVKFEEAENVEELSAVYVGKGYGTDRAVF